MMNRQCRPSMKLKPAAAAVSFMVMLASGGVWADPIQVWVQPSGSTLATAYALQGEARTYFGRTECNACGSLEYKWEFSDGTTTAFAGVADPRYIEYTPMTFATAGTHYARLTVRDSADPANTATAQVNLEVIASAADDLNRQVNSAIDRGLRRMYLNENVSGNQSYWGGSGAYIGSTGMALIAFENQAHNLQSPDSDIYKKSVQRGIQYLLENASIQNLTTQTCIGDPEANDGDGDNDGLGIRFGGDDMYTASIAVLALANSADQAVAQSTLVSTSNALNGMSLHDIGIDAKDWLAWAQNDGGSGGGSSVGLPMPDGWGAVYYAGDSVTDLQGYFYGHIPSIGGCGGDFHIDWGDGTSSTYTDNQMWCPYYGDYGYPELSYYNAGPSHTYAASGNYTVTVDYQAGGITTPMGSTVVPIVVAGGTACGYAQATQGAGGWRYSSNYSDADNSVTQWPTLALAELENRWAIQVNPEVKTMLGHWLDYSQCSNGAYGYHQPDYWCNFPKTAAGVIMLHYAGRTAADTDLNNALGFLDSNWGTYGYDNNFANFYSMYGLYKGMKIWGMTNLGAHAWEDEYRQHLVSTQASGGEWYDGGSWEDSLFSTYTAIAILAPDVASLPPVANAGGAYPPILRNQNLMLDGSASFHKDAPNKHLVKYEWDFDATDGLWWNTKVAPDAGEGATGITPNASWANYGSYTVTLRVTDDSTPAEHDTDTEVVTVTNTNVAPVPVTNGPWTSLPGAAIIFDGTASYDPNACTTPGDPACLPGHHIASYEWDLDGDGNFNEVNGEDGAPLTAGDYSKVSKAFSNPGSLPVVLRVTDNEGLSAISGGSVNVVSIALVYGQSYSVCFRQSIDRFTERQGIQVTFQNQGTGAADNVAMTLTNSPTNMTVLKGVANLGTMDPGETVTTACDPATKTAEIELRFSRRISPTGTWLWSADFDFGATHYLVNNIPPIGP